MLNIGRGCLVPVTMLNIRRGCLVPVTMLNIRRGRRREHHKDTSKGSRDLRSLRVLRNFRLRIRTPKWTPEGSSDLRSHPVAMLLLLRKKTRGKKPGKRRIYFRSGPLPVTWLCHFRSKNTHPGGYCATSGCACAEHTSGQGTWLMSLPVTSLPVAPPHSTTANVALSVPIYYFHVL